MIVLASFNGVLNGVTITWKKGEPKAKATFEFEPEELEQSDLDRLGQHTGMAIRIVLTTAQTSFDAETGELAVALEGDEHETHSG